MTPTPAIHQLGNSFDDRNVCLNATLGVISFLRRFKAILREHGAASPESVDTTEPVDGDALVHATLGLVSFSVAMKRSLELTRTPASGLRARRVGGDSNETDAPVLPRELLR